jgi:hypothetical protein
MKLHEEITYDNYSSPIYGFVQQFQCYRLLPTNAVLVGMGLAKRNSYDAEMRWYADLKDRGNWDLPHVNSLPIIVGDWIHMEVQVLITDQANGYLRIYQDGILLIDYAGPTVANYWETVGCSWGIYGQLLTVGNPTNVVNIDYDECLISTVGTYPQLLLPSAPGGMGDPVLAQLAQGAGTAYDATITTFGSGTNAPAGLAVGTGTSQAPSVTASGNTVTGLAQATGTSQSATTTSSGNTVTGLASGIGTSQSATSKSSPVVPVAVGTGTGSNATTTSSGNTVTGLASGTGTAANATVVTGALAQAGLALAVGTSQTPTVTANGNTVTGLALGTGTASNVGGGIGGGVGPAAGTGTAFNATTRASGNTVTEVAPGTGTSWLATVSTSSAANAPAGVAAGTGTAWDVVGRFIPAGLVTAIGSAGDASIAVRPSVPVAVATATAPTPTAVTGTLAVAGVASGTGTGSNVTSRSSGNAPAGVGQVIGAAADPGGTARTPADVAQGTGTVPSATATKAVAAQAGAATINATAYGATVTLARIAQAESALALALAHGAVAYTVAPGHANALTATARAAAYGAARRLELQGGIPGWLEPAALIVITPTRTGTDSFGNGIWDYGPGAVRRNIVGWVQQHRRTEGFMPGRDPLEESWLLITNDSGLTGSDRIQWLTYPTGPITFEIEGPPEPVLRPSSGFHHTEATMRAVTG